MEKVIINTTKAPKAIGPYVQAVKYGTMIFTSGQIPLNPTTGEVTGTTIEEQARQVFDNMKAILDCGQSSLKNVIKVTIYLTDMNNYPKMNEIFSLYFDSSHPARTCVEVSRLPKDVLIEAEAVAISY